jgi:hypothetical protein
VKSLCKLKQNPESSDGKTGGIDEWAKAASRQQRTNRLEKKGKL